MHNWNRELDFLFCIRVLATLHGVLPTPALEWLTRWSEEVVVLVHKGLCKGGGYLGRYKGVCICTIDMNRCCELEG